MRLDLTLVGQLSKLFLGATICSKAYDQDRCHIHDNFGNDMNGGS